MDSIPANVEIARSLRRFVRDVGALVGAHHDEPVLLPKLGDAMRALVATDDWLDPAFAMPDPVYYQQYLLYADPDDRFSVVSFVWGPGQHTPIHDHTVWGVIGMLRGVEIAQNYQLAADGVPVASGGPIELTPGAVEFVSPTIGDIHEVKNAFDDRVSISIHAYGANIGRVERHVYPRDGGPPKLFVSGYSNVTA